MLNLPCELSWEVDSGRQGQALRKKSTFSGPDRKHLPVRPTSKFENTIAGLHFEGHLSSTNLILECTSFSRFKF